MALHPPPTRDRSTRIRVTTAGVAGLVAAAALGLAVGWRYAAPGGWPVAAAVYVAWTWTVIGGMDADDTAAHATREDPGRAGTDLLVLVASIASLGGVVYLLTKAAPFVASSARLPRSHGNGEEDDMLLAIGAILLVLWLLGLLVFHLGAIIHVLLVIAVIVVVLHFVRGRRAGV